VVTSRNKEGCLMILPRIYLLISIIALSFSPIFITALTMPPSIIAMYRVIFILLVLLPLFPKHRHRFRGIAKKYIAFACLSGIFLALHFILTIYALRDTTILSNSVLATLEPLFVFIGSLMFYQKKFRFRTIISIAIALIGGFSLVFSNIYTAASKVADPLLGDMLTIVATIMISMYMLIGQKLATHMHMIVYHFYVFSSASAGMIAYNLITKQAFTGYETKQWELMLLLALIPTIFGAFLQNWLLHHLSARTLTISILGSPIGSNLFAYFFYQQIPTPIQIGASLVTMFGVLLFLTRR
jgi:drug/metabolite transporter (DMT)-like permease